MTYHITDQHVTVVEVPTVRWIETPCYVCGYAVASLDGSANTCMSCGPYVAPAGAAEAGYRPSDAEFDFPSRREGDGWAVDYSQPSARILALRKLTQEETRS